MSSSSASGTSRQPHIALFPGAEMGHLTPFLRLASMLHSQNCLVTLITVKPTVSLAESENLSKFFSTHPEIKHVEFQVLPLELESPNTKDDPFWVQFKAICDSAHLLPPLLSALSPPPSAIFSDFVVATGASHIATDLGIPHYVVVTTSAKFFSVIAYLPILISDPTKFSNLLTEIEIPGLTAVPLSSIPPPMFNPNSLFTSIFISNNKALSEVEGILLNTFELFEPETLSVLNKNNIFNSLPPVLSVGPLLPYMLEREEEPYLQWLDKQPAESVVYVSFGSRTAMSENQMIELRDGLERSGYRFLWVVKSKIIDQDDKQSVEELLSLSFLERTRNKGMVVKGWVKQQEILAHPAIGGFISHCGWNSVIEAARRGVPVLAWPLGGDQRVNADVLENAGLGTWDRSWGWAGQRLVMQDEIQIKICELMEDQKLRNSAKKVGEEACKAGKHGGSSNMVILQVIESLSQCMKE